LPDGWSELNLRGETLQNMAGQFGLESTLVSLTDFLDTPEGSALGTVNISEVSRLFAGGLPALAGVYVVDAPGWTAESMAGYLLEQLALDAALIPGVTVESLTTGEVNGLPVIMAIGNADLAAYDYAGTAFVKSVGFFAGDKIYVLVLAGDGAERATLEGDFDQIIGTFRPAP
jgi:hypothetical protein